MLLTKLKRIPQIMSSNEEDTIQLILNEFAAKMLLKSVDIHIDRWAGGEPIEQAALNQLRHMLRAAVLEFQMNRQ